ncbi:unnamed protein product [Angiostrongylus costaricensis]|uniref:Myb-like domain-containing protein n=1 Tax=Angiostrongylus costaricensis TaxID=334426 RepID=A0A158PDJ4_ANGCS|nr:unnamed protein product [Angiostrongylus costaricensis]
MGKRKGESCEAIFDDMKRTSNELHLLREAVKKSVIEACIENFVDRQEILHSKILRAGVETSTEEVQRWKKEIEALDHKIKQSSAELADLQEGDLVDYSCVDWSMISAIDFNGTRSAAALECKWLNERSQWNNGPWTEQEMERLKQLRENETLTSWTETNDWTDEEDERLVLGGNVLGRGGWEEFAEILPRQKPEGVRMPYRRLLSIILKLRSEKRSRFICKISSAAVAAYKTRRDVMLQKLTFGGIQRRRYRDAKQRTEKKKNATRSNTLSHQRVGAANSFKHFVPPPPRTTLPLTFTTTSAYRIFERARPSLTERALCYFPPRSENQIDTDAFGMPNGNTRKFTAYDRLNIELHPSILGDHNYLKLKAQVRCLLLEPMRLAFAIDPPDARKDLMRMVIDEEELLYEEEELGDVGNEMEITSTEQCRPIDCEESADDALTKTIETPHQKKTLMYMKEKFYLLVQRRESGWHYLMGVLLLTTV